MTIRKSRRKQVMLQNQETRQRLLESLSRSLEAKIETLYGRHTNKILYLGNLKSDSQLLKKLVLFASMKALSKR